MHTLLQGDCFEIMPTLLAGSIDAIITDPPFGALNVEWDTKPNYELFNIQVRRLCKDFYAFFGQMPNFLEPVLQNEKDGWKCIEHISWIKRNGMPGGNENRLVRSHESIFIYSISGETKFYSNTGKWEDVKIPGIYFDVMSIEGFRRYVSALWAKIDGKSTSKKSGTYKKASEFKARFDRGNSVDRAARLANFTNVWSFLPASKSEYGKTDKHPTEKPVEVMKRLVEMLTPEGGTVLDPFMGSGSTGVACKQLNRNFIGIERDNEFFKIATRRIENTQVPLFQEPSTPANTASSGQGDSVRQSEFILP